MWAALSTLFWEHHNGAIPLLGMRAMIAYMTAACHELDHILLRQVYGRARPQLAIVGAARAWTRFDIPPWFSRTGLHELRLRLEAIMTPPALLMPALPNPL